MASSVAKARPSMPLNSIETRMAKASIDLNASVESRVSDPAEQALSLVFETLDAIGMSDKEAAYTMGIEPSELSRAKSRQAKLDIRAVWRLPDRFWAEYRRRVDAAKGLTAEREIEQDARRIGELVTLLVRHMGVRLKVSA